MATLVFSSVGTALGGPIGGAIGALAGRQIDSALFGASGRQGARLRELDVSLSSYGSAIPRIHGRMRVPGSIIWASELQEHSELVGTGKGQPALTTYSYSANLAVALSSRPIHALGRIWADGKLLRGAMGDLKTAGQLRVYTGQDDQPVDPLIAASEGTDRCPAFRDLAYVVFESLDLSDYGNRIPALTFEVIADETVSLHAILGDSLASIDVPSGDLALSGFAIEDSVGSSLSALNMAMPIAIDAGTETIVIRRDACDSKVIALDEPAISVDDDAFGRASGFSRTKAASAPQPPAILRYYDIDRDFLPSVQHASGRTAEGQPSVVELPASLDPATARALVEQITRRRTYAQDQIAWRATTLDTSVAPGVLVTLPDRSGIWRVDSWEWRDTGVDLALVRVPTKSALPSIPPPQMFPAPIDLPPANTRVACELPWDGVNGAPDRPHVAVAASGTGRNWDGAALYMDRGDGQLRPLGPSKRARAVTGLAQNALGHASTLLVDRSAELTVSLDASDLALTSASIEDLALGENLALVGEELIQFAKAEHLGGSHWRISGLLRGLHGTEAAIGLHSDDEDFALLDARISTFEADFAGEIIASGHGDAVPVSANSHLAGLAQRPLSPVYPRVTISPEGDAHFAWIRRARGGWIWRDGVDVPIAEAAENYLLTYENDNGVLRGWELSATAHTLSAAHIAELRSLYGEGAFWVRQQGTHGLSNPLHLALPL